MNKEQIVFITSVIKGMPDFSVSLRTQKASCARAFMNAIDLQTKDYDSELFGHRFNSEQFLVDCGVNE
jgi:5-bromo-4-chloroindolyl phosphate hydrolysis protein